MGNPKRSSTDRAKQPIMEMIAEPVTDVLAELRDLIRDDEQDTAPAIRDEPVFKEAMQALSKIEDRYALTKADRVSLRHALFWQALRQQDVPELRTAPELWSERRGTKENPVTFIRRVYAPWLGRGLRRSQLLTLDKPLYMALGVWMHRHPDIGFPELDR